MADFPPRDSSRVLNDVVQRLCASYNIEDSVINHLRDSTLPGRKATIRILNGLKDTLFPDHRLGRQVRSGQTDYNIGAILERVHEELRQQIHQAHSYDYGGEGARLPELREILALDVQAAMDGDPAAHSFDEIIFCYPGFEAIVTYRIAHELYLLGVPLLPRIMTEYAHTRTGTDIHPGANIGRSFFIDHATGVVVGETTVIGERVKLYQGVTLGALSFPKDEKGQLVRDTKRHPTIEDDVVIYAGATVLGGETIIGQGAVVGGSCWIIHSIPPGTKVALQDPLMKIRGPKP
jgi:serine O-acetyltransferase